MVLVDTTVWIDLFAGRSTPQVRDLEQRLLAAEDICICGPVLTEVLQGIRHDADCARVREQFASFVYLTMGRETFEHAAALYRGLRRQGITIRKPVDCMIAAVAIEHSVPLLHNDRDFDPLAIHCGLAVVPAEQPDRR